MGVALLHKKDGLEWKFLLVLGFLQGNATKHWSKELLVAGGHSVCCRMFGSNPGYNPTRHISTLSPEFWQLKTSPDIACHVSWWAGMTDVDVTCESRLTSSAENPQGKKHLEQLFSGWPLPTLRASFYHGRVSIKWARYLSVRWSNISSSDEMPSVITPWRQFTFPVGKLLKSLTDRKLESILDTACCKLISDDLWGNGFQIQWSQLK